MLLFTLKASIHLFKQIKKNKEKNSIIYNLGSRVGPFYLIKRRFIKKYNIKTYLNPDGIEWKRSKWNKLIKLYLKISEKYMVKSSSLIICDSKAIQKYISETYPGSKSKYISYGAELDSKNDINGARKYLEKYNLDSRDFYLVLCRFVPENNIELILQGFKQSKTNKKLLLITNYTKNDFYDYLLKTTEFLNDDRIIFGEPIYEKKIVATIRNLSSCYIHGHSVGGTNPSLLESLAQTQVNLLFDCEFNKEVGRDACLYFKKDQNELTEQINNVDQFDEKTRLEFQEKARQIIKSNYNWNDVIKAHNNVFENISE